jgi:hypothetical protein
MKLSEGWNKAEQYVYQGKKKLFSTGQKVDPEFWDGKKEQVKHGNGFWFSSRRDC